MNLYFSSSFLALCCLAIVSGETLEEAIIKDIMPERSSMCTPTPGTTSSDFTFASSQEESEWFDGYPESYAQYNAPWSQLEQYVFNAKMMHTDANANRTWTLRLGKGGNIYSFVGPMGETVAPQKRDDSPWIDEVWHSVGVEPPQPEEPFMIHGAGSYQSDKTYDENVGIPVTEIPFYSPSLGKYCNDGDSECGFVAWAQHGPIPVYWESTMINFNRYVDCGNGVIEHTAVHHNNMGSDKNLMRLDAPFGSVRFSKLRDVVVTDATSEILIKPHELGRYDLTPKKFAAADSMGYAIFAEDLPSPLSGPYPLTAGLSYTIHDVGCRNAPDYVSGYPAVMCRIEPTVADPSGTRVAVTFRGTPPVFSVCDENDLTKCIDTVRFIKYASGAYCRNFGTEGAIMCRLDHIYLENFAKQSSFSAGVQFTTQSGEKFTATGGIMFWSFAQSDVYSLILNPMASGDATTAADINSLIIADEDWTMALAANAEAGGDVTAKNGVVNWAKHIVESDAYWLFFNADEIPGVPDMGSYVATKFPPGTTLEVLYDTGKPEEDNLALAHVYGKEFPDTQGLADGWPKVIIGNANEGFKPRDANVYNIVTTAAKMYEGGSHYFRQYFVMDRFSDISAVAASYKDEVIQQNYNVKDANDSDKIPVGRTVKLYKSGNNVGVTIGDVQTCGVDVPTDAPTSSPTTSPSSSPTDCMGMEDPVLTTAVCKDGENAFPVPAILPDSIVVRGDTGTSVDVTITQNWDDVVAIALKHSDLNLESQCTIDAAVQKGDTFDFAASCANGLTTATIILYYGTFDESDCQACDVEEIESMSGHFCAYTVSIPCQPIPVDCTASPTSSPTTADPTSSPTTAHPTSSPTTADPTSSPTTAHPTSSPTTAHPTSSPTTADPTSSPTTADPTSSPTTADPTSSPTTAHPTSSPTTAHPTSSPTTADPTSSPTTAHPTSSPTTADPTSSPTTAHPTSSPTTADPTSSPTTADPTSSPTTAHPTSSPTTADPTSSPTTADPTSSPTTADPTSSPTTADPTSSPTTADPTSSPTTANPTSSPTLSPTTADPTSSPTLSPTTADPTSSPTLSPTTAQAPLTPYPMPKDRRGNTLVLQSAGSRRIAVGKKASRKAGRCVINAKLLSHTKNIRGGEDEKLVFHFSNAEGTPTNDMFHVDGVRLWYWKGILSFYPSAPYDTEENCEAGREVFAEMFAKKYYISVTYPEGHQTRTLVESEEENETRKLVDNNEESHARKLVALDPVCVGSTTPNKDSKALFEIKCGSATYIGSDPYYFAPDGFDANDTKLRPYICKNDARARGNWKLLGFFPEGACSLIETDHVFDESTCETDVIQSTINV